MSLIKTLKSKLKVPTSTLWNALIVLLLCCCNVLKVVNSGIEVVKTFNLQGHFQDVFDDTLEGVAETEYKAGRLNYLVSGVASSSAY